MISVGSTRPCVLDSIDDLSKIIMFIRYLLMAFFILIGLAIAGLYGCELRSSNGDRHRTQHSQKYFLE